MTQTRHEIFRPWRALFIAMVACACANTLAGATEAAPESADPIAACRAGETLNHKQYQSKPELFLERHAEVLDACNRLIAGDGLGDEDLAQALLYRADMQAPEVGLPDYDRAIGLAPEMADAYWRRGKANLLYARDLPAALRDLDKAIALDGRNAELYVTRSSIHAWSGRTPQSLADLETALRIDPKSVHALTNRGLAHLDNGETAKALADLDRAIALSPDDWSLYGLRSAARLHAGDKVGSERDAAIMNALMEAAR